MELIKKIVGFGDSWMWGDELLDPALIHHPQAHPVMSENTSYRESRCFLGLLGAHYGVPAMNFGSPGGSQQSARWNYIWWRQHETVPLDRVLILVAHTDSARFSHYNPKHISYGDDPEWNRYIHSAWVWGGSLRGHAFEDFVQQETVLTDCDALHRLRFIESVLFFRGQDSPVLQFCQSPAPLHFEDATLLWPDRSLGELIRERCHPKLSFAPNGHPNERGHEIIRDLLIPQIDRVIMQ